jgi:hypothetical protein
MFLLPTRVVLAESAEGVGELASHELVMGTGSSVTASSRRRGGPEPVGESDDEVAEFVWLLDGERQVE